MRAFVAGRRPLRPPPFNLHTNRTADSPLKAYNLIPVITVLSHLSRLTQIGPTSPITPAIRYIFVLGLIRARSAKSFVTRPYNLAAYHHTVLHSTKKCNCSKQLHSVAINGTRHLPFILKPKLYIPSSRLILPSSVHIARNTDEASVPA